MQNHAWTFMLKHMHHLAMPDKEGAISRGMQVPVRMYVGCFNPAYRCSGTLWEGCYKSGVVQSLESLLKCYRYIELSPIRAKMAADPPEYF